MFLHLDKRSKIPFEVIKIFFHLDERSKKCFSIGKKVDGLSTPNIMPCLVRSLMGKML
jgi:hypothetical protein